MQFIGVRRLVGNSQKEIANKYRDLLIELYGEEQGRKIQYAEAFEACGYGVPLMEENKRVIFPFFPEL